MSVSRSLHSNSQAGSSHTNQRTMLPSAARLSVGHTSWSHLWSLHVGHTCDACLAMV
jgi:hypothetical protein